MIVRNVTIVFTTFLFDVMIVHEYDYLPAYICCYRYSSKHEAAGAHHVHYLFNVWGLSCPNYVIFKNYIITKLIIKDK